MLAARELKGIVNKNAETLPLPLLEDRVFCTLCFLISICSRSFDLLDDPWHSYLPALRPGPNYLDWDLDTEPWDLNVMSF